MESGTKRASCSYITDYFATNAGLRLPAKTVETMQGCPLSFYRGERTTVHWGILILSVVPRKFAKSTCRLPYYRERTNLPFTVQKNPRSFRTARYSTAMHQNHNEYRGAPKPWDTEYRGAPKPYLTGNIYRKPWFQGSPYRSGDINRKLQSLASGQGKYFLMDMLLLYWSAGSVLDSSPP